MALRPTCGQGHASPSSLAEWLHRVAKAGGPRGHVPSCPQTHQPKDLGQHPQALSLAPAFEPWKLPPSRRKGSRLSGTSMEGRTLRRAQQLLFTIKCSPDRRATEASPPQVYRTAAQMDGQTS